MRFQPLPEDPFFSFCLQEVAVFQKNLWLLGVDQRGCTVSLRVIDFEPTFLVKPNETWSTLSDDEWDSLMEEKLEDWQEQLHFGIQGYKMVKKIPFVGFTNRRQDRLLEITTTLAAWKKTVKIFNEDPDFDRLYHTSFDPSISFFHQKAQVGYQSWLSVPTPCIFPAQKWRTSFQGSVMSEQIKPLSSEAVPRIRKCFLRFKAISRDALVLGEAHHDLPFLYHPQAALPADRIIAITISYRWLGETKNSHEFVWSLLPHAQAEWCRTEADLLAQVADNIINFDPDALFYYPDQYQDWDYLSQRDPNFVHLERHPNLKVKPYRRDGHFISMKLQTRALFDLQKVLKKKATMPLESYRLRDVAQNPKVMRNPVPGPLVDRDRQWAKVWKLKGTAAASQWVVQQLLEERTWMEHLENDNATFLEFANISKVSDTGLNKAVNGGEQIRVFNKLAHFCVDDGFYINPEQLNQKPLRLSRHEYPPTFPDPLEHPKITRLRQQCMAALRQLKKQGRTVSQRGLKLPVVPTEEKISNEAEGGNVIKPCPKFWLKELLAILDFASLYPSIMRAFNVSYENLVFERQYLGLPGVDYLYVLINKDEVVAIADCPGLMPKLLTLLIEARKKVKKLMKQEKDPFLYSVYDKAQASLKVLCNAVYGFTGADGASGILPIKEIMYVVTSFGRYLQKKTADFLVCQYGVVTVYGDTDSVFVHIELEGLTLDQMFSYARHRYAMPTLCWVTVANFFRVEVAVIHEAWSRAAQIRGLAMVVADKLAEECSNLFRDPVELELENLCTRTFMSDRKKHYFLNFWDPSSCVKRKKIKITGMPVKKREWCRWTRQVLMGVTQRLADDQLEGIESYLRTNLQALVEEKVALDDLKVSCEYKDNKVYKTLRSDHLQLILKLEARRRVPIPDHSRIYKVILKGDAKQYLRAEDPAWVAEKGLKLDYEYYLSKQFYRPMKSLLQFVPDLLDFNALYLEFLNQVKMKGQFGGTQRLTLAALRKRCKQQL